MSEQTYLTTDELAARIKYDARTIRDRLKDSVLLEGVHYIRPFGGRKILYRWDAIERDIGKRSQENGFVVPKLCSDLVYQRGLIEVEKAAHRC